MSDSSDQIPTLDEFYASGGAQGHRLVEAADYFDEVGHSVARWEWTCSCGSADRGSWPRHQMDSYALWRQHCADSPSATEEAAR